MGICLCVHTWVCEDTCVSVYLHVWVVNSTSSWWSTSAPWCRRVLATSTCPLWLATVRGVARSYCVWMNIVLIGNTCDPVQIAEMLASATIMQHVQRWWWQLWQYMHTDGHSYHIAYSHHGSSALAWTLCHMSQYSVWLDQHVDTHSSRQQCQVTVVMYSMMYLTLPTYLKKPAEMWSYTISTNMSIGEIELSMDCYTLP